MRAVRSTDDEPVIFTARQVSRLLYITSSVGAAYASRDADDLEEAIEQLAHVTSFLSAHALDVEGAPTSPSATERWEELDALPYYLSSTEDRELVRQRAAQGLNPYGEPI